MSYRKQSAYEYRDQIHEEIEMTKDLCRNPVNQLFDIELMWEELQEELVDAEQYLHDMRLDDWEVSSQESYLVISAPGNDNYGYGAGLCTACGHPIPMNFYSDEGPFCRDCHDEAADARHEQESAGLHFAWESDLIQRTSKGR